MSSTARCISAIVFSSAEIRDCASFNCWSRAIASSAAPPPLPVPASRETRSLSEPGAAAGVRSSTAAPIRPADSRVAPPADAGAAAARRSRYVRQSEACMRTIFVASDAGVACVSAALGMSRIAPARNRFMLSPSNADWLRVKSAASIWSSVTSAGLYCVAILCKRVAAADRVLSCGRAGRTGAARRCCRRRRRRRALRRGCARARRRAGARRRDGLGSGGGSGHSRRIEQERVFAHDTAGSPVEFDEKIEERLLHRHRGRDLQIRRAAGRFDGDPGARKGGLVRQVVLAIQARISNLGAQRIEIFLRHRLELDPGRQRLPERRIEGQLAEPQRQGVTGKRQRACHEAVCKDGFCAHADLFGLAV